MAKTESMTSVHKKLKQSPRLSQMDMTPTEKVSLHPDLEDYVGLDGNTLDHPLVRGLVASQEDISLLNKIYESKKRQLEECIRQRKWMSYPALHERPYRVEALLDLMNDFDLSGSELWPVVAYVWSDTESVRANLDAWRSIWSSHYSNRHLVMDENERRVLDQLPEHLTVWRGASHRDAVQSFSWTLDREKAVWFSHRFADDNDPLLLANGRVSKAHVLAYFAGRKEAEIVVFPEYFQDITVAELSRG